MSQYQRRIYQSESGDSWWLCRDESGRVLVLHEPNFLSDAKATKLELKDFLKGGRAGPEHQALLRLIGEFTHAV